MQDLSLVLTTHRLLLASRHQPPLGLIGSTSAASPTTAQSSLYNVRGRFFLAGAKYKL